MRQKLLIVNKNKNLSLLTFSLILITSTLMSCAQTITSNQTGTHNGFYFSFWNQGAGNTSFKGTPTMTLGDAGNYSIKWANVNNFTAGKGWAKGSPDRIINFTGTFDGGSNGYLAVYGWTKNALIEYYVVENYGGWTPPGGTAKGSFTSDGGTYKIYETTRTNQPSIVGTATFQQYWSVRTTRRSSGTVTFANHVAAWKSFGMELGTTWDYQIMETEGYNSSGSSNITVSEGTVSSENLPFNENEISIFPNPVTNKVNIVLPGAKCVVSLLSSNGEQLMTMETEKANAEIDMTEYKAGLYLLKTTTGGQTTTRKIIKQ